MKFNIVLTFSKIFSLFIFIMGMVYALIFNDLTIMVNMGLISASLIGVKTGIDTVVNAKEKKNVSRRK